MRSFLIGATALALVAGAAHAQGNGRGNDDRGSGKPAAADQRGEQGREEAHRGNSGRQPDRPSMAASSRGPDNRGNSDRGRQSAERGNGSDNPSDRAVERTRERAVSDRGRGPNGRFEEGRSDIRLRDFVSLEPRGLIRGCPPGLARKRNGCQPPGQDRRDDWLFGYFQPDWWGMPWLGDGRYFYRDGYLLRLDGRGIGGYIPLLGGALGIGNTWPSYYNRVPVPDYYVDYYGLGPYDSYRYADNVIYRVNPETSAITSVAALLTGDEFAVGRPMPPGYDIYNVPWGYRDRYYDRPDAWYRYGDGRIYQVDPETRLIAAVIEMIAT